MYGKHNLNLRIKCLSLGLGILLTTSYSKIPDGDKVFTDEEEGSIYPPEILRAKDL